MQGLQAWHQPLPRLKVLIEHTHQHNVHTWICAAGMCTDLCVPTVCTDETACDVQAATGSAA
jgi:hypothetical protein